MCVFSLLFSIIFFWTYFSIFLFQSEASVPPSSSAPAPGTAPAPAPPERRGRATLFIIQSLRPLLTFPLLFRSPLITQKLWERIADNLDSFG